MRSYKPLHLLSACVCMCASEHVLRLVLSPPATRTWWMDKRSISVTLRFHHLLGLPLCKSAFPSPPSFSGSHTHAHTFSINFSLAYTSHNQLHHALTLTSWGHITHQKKWPMFFGHMLEPVKCVAFPLPWRRINSFLFPADVTLYNKSYVGKATSKM